MVAKAAKLTRLSKAGRTKLRFSGRIGSKTLKPGVYRATFTPRDAAGNTGKPARVSLTVVKGRAPRCNVRGLPGAPGARIRE